MLLADTIVLACGGAMLMLLAVETLPGPVLARWADTTIGGALLPLIVGKFAILGGLLALSGSRNWPIATGWLWLALANDEQWFPWGKSSSLSTWGTAKVLTHLFLQAALSATIFGQGC